MLRTGAATGAWLASAPAALASTAVRPSQPEAAPSLEAAIRAFTGGAPVRAGKVRVQIAPLVDNGNTVPLSVTVDHPMRPDDHVAAIAVFSERNPQHEVASFGLSPRNPAAKVSTRIRLATSQKLVAVARLSDGSHWSGEVDVIVTLAACIED
jgi:sulfur-oxidizing protein SoxY